MTTRLAILDDYQGVALGLADWMSLRCDIAVFRDTLADADASAARLAPFEAIVAMRERTPFPRALIERLPRLRLLITTGMRNRSIDLVACAERGITVCGTLAAGDPTADLTWALILGLMRRVPESERALREGRWQTTLGLGLEGRTLGVVGLGKLGARVARIGQAFGMRVVAWSENLTDARAAEVGAARVDKAELFAQADVVTLHYVLSPRSRGLVGAAELDAMRPHAVIVNTSRGPLIDQNALVAALHAGRIGGAGLDVFDTEPLPADHPLLAAPNTLLLPHLGYVTEENYRAYFAGAVEAVAAWQAGKPVRVLRPE